MAKQLLKKYPKYQRKVFDSRITGDETWVHFYEPKQKVYNRIWALEHAKRPSTAKQTLTTMKVLYAIFFRNSGHLCKLLFQKCVQKPVSSMSICNMTMLQPTNLQL